MLIEIELFIKLKLITNNSTVFKYNNCIKKFIKILTTNFNKNKQSNFYCAGERGRSEGGGGEVGVQPRGVHQAGAPHDQHMERRGAEEVLRSEEGVPVIRFNFIVSLL